MSWNKAKWKKGKKAITGEWCYVWHQDRFWVQLDGKDDLGMKREAFEVAGDEPEFNGWKLVKEDKCRKLTIK